MNRTDQTRGVLTQCQQLSISLSGTSQGLVIEGSERAITNEIVTGLREFKSELLEMLNPSTPVYETPSKPEKNRGLGYGDKGDTTQNTSWQPDEPLDWEALPEPIECEQCGSIDAWWNVLGARRCAVCDPPTASRRWLEKADRLRRKYDRRRQRTELEPSQSGE